MENYAKMYAVLCGAIDDVIDELERLPEAAGCAQRLKDALLQAEEIYCSGEKVPEEKSFPFGGAGSRQRD